MTPERLEKIKQVLDKRQPDLRVITDHVHKGRNLSAIVRTADAVGISDMHCVMDDKDYLAFRGTTMGSHQWVNVSKEKDITTIICTLKAQGYQFVAADVTPSSVDFRQVDYTQPTALIMGAEKWGLSDEVRSQINQFITVPMVGMVESFNVSVASAIILSEAQRQRDLAGMYSRRRIDQECYERLFFEWSQPKIAVYCQRYQLSYPGIDKHGDIIEASAWYQSVRHVEVGSSLQKSD